MKFLNKFNLKTKILSGFFVVAIISIAIGVIGIYNLNKIDDKNTNLNDKIANQISDLSKENKDQDSTLKLIQIKSNLNQNTSDNSNTIKNSKNLMLVLIVIGGIIAILLGIIITQAITKPIYRLVDYADRLALGDINIEIESETKDEIGILMLSFKKMIENIRENAIAAEKISKGDFSLKIEQKSKNDTLAKSMILIVESLNNLEKEAEILTTAAVEGKLSTRGNADKFQGDYKRIVEGINKTLDAVIVPLNVAADYVDKISKGNMPPKIDDKYSGDFNIIKNNLNACIDNINKLVEDANMLSQAALEGMLSTRADAAKHSGDYRLIVEGINKTLDAICEPINESRVVLAKMALNDLTTKMKGSYNGMMKELAEDINSVHTRLNSIASLLKDISAGNTSRIDELSKIGKRSENDELMPLMILMMRNIQNLIDEASMIADSAVKGNLQTRSNASRFQGGYRQVLEGFNKALDAMEKPIKEAEEVLKEMASGNLCVSMEGNYLGSYKIIKDSLNNTLNSLNELLGKISEASEQVLSGSTQVSNGSQALSQGTTEQASAIEELTASIGEVAAQTKQNAANATQANQLALNAKDGAALGNTHMKEMLKSMDEINESSTNISKIIKVIDDIAFQTNILALNAAVEAARAGQHGKGFAVVAEEVRNLAARSASAAKETTDLIEGSINKVELGTKIANNTADALDAIVEGVSKAAELVGEIAIASNEQATAISQVNRGVEQVSDVVQTNSATAEESAAASEELSSQASTLKNMIKNFKLRKDSLTFNNGTEFTDNQSFTHSRIIENKNKPKISLGEFGKY